MLILKDIHKEYTGFGDAVKALKGVDIAFRRSEFVSVLGPSGCGKTTLLNIIGGLDQYTSGDLIINGRSTKEYKDNDWDAYRNHSVGFVFQTYNLIQHQSVLANVELALTLSGVSRVERRARAAQALEQVGLGDQIKKKPNQLSGGQMQRVAIARALVNDPDILLADEPTGALDTDTSVQVLDILKQVARDRLVIMVTHNPDLAERYSTRIVHLLDGKITGDTDPYDAVSGLSSGQKTETSQEKKPSMSFKTAFLLSLNNLMTKKRRTLLTAFAGSIGIIGIALILSLSTGFQNYIDSVESDTLSNYPISVEAETIDFTSLMGTLMGVDKDNKTQHGMDKIYTSDVMGNMFNSMTSEVKANDLKSFMRYIQSGDSGLEAYVSDIEYLYDVDLQVYSADTSQSVIQVNPSTILDKITNTPGATEMRSEMISFGSSNFSQSSSFDVFVQMQGSQTLLDSQFDIVSGAWPKAYDEVVLIVNKDNEISDLTLYTLNLLDQNELSGLIKRIKNGENVENVQVSYDYGDLIGLEFSLVLPTDYYSYDEGSGAWADMRSDQSYMTELVSNAQKLKVVGIVRPADDSMSNAQYGGIGYMPDLMRYYMQQINSTEIVKTQLNNPDIDVFTGIAFSSGSQGAEDITIDDVYAYIATLSEDEQAQISPYLDQMTEEQIIAQFKEQMQAQTTTATYADNIVLLGVANEDQPTIINLYPKDFEAKDNIEAVIKTYNDLMTQEGKDDQVISYTDYVGMLMSNVTKIINTISYVLIAFVAISLIVSSIMIGVITNISVLERTKEIGILRSIGASKRDISHVFNAETFIVGLAAGLIGVGLTLLLCIPINIIIKSLTNIPDVAALEFLPAIILVAISVILTLVAGLVPSRSAARKDPVEALRTE